MMNIEKWATSPAISSLEHWERLCPGYGAKIVEVMAPFQDWKPIFGEAHQDLERDILAGAHWMDVRAVRITPLDQADEAQTAVSQNIDEALEKLRPDGPNRWYAANDVVGSTFGPVIGDPRTPAVLLRSWLYLILVEAVLYVLADDQDRLAQVNKILVCWKRGNFLIGFDTREPRTAIVIVGDPVVSGPEA